jgi:hypothetical protein
VVREDDRTPPAADEPTFRQLVDWVEGRLTRTEAAAVQAAIEAGGPSVGETVAWVRGFIEFGRSHPLPAPPPLVRQRLRQSFGRHHGWAGPPRRERAELMFDSRDDAVVVGVRGGPSFDDGYRLAFATDTLGVLVDVLPESNDTIRLEGQVLTPQGVAPVWQITVHHPGGRHTAIDGDANGSFAIDGVPLDTDRVVLSNGELDVEIDQPLGRQVT